MLNLKNLNGGAELAIAGAPAGLCFCLTDDCSNTTEILASDTENPPPLKIMKIKESFQPSVSASVKSQ